MNRLRHSDPRRAVLSAMAVALVATAAVSAAADDPLTVQDGRKVGIEYTLRLEDGTTASSNVGEAPLVFTQGAGDILPALSRALDGLRVSDEKHVTLEPVDGYGPVNPDAFVTVRSEEIPEGARQVGAGLIAQDGQGGQQPVRVHEVREEEIVLDLNHPLAGQTLIFDVRILSIE